MAIQSIRRGGSASISTIISVIFATLLCTVFFWASFVVSNASTSFESNLLITVQVDADLPQEDVDVLIEEISLIEGVESVTYETSDEQLDALIESYGELGPTFEIYKGEDNPLDAAIKVEVDDAAQLQPISDEISQLPNVKHSLYGGSEVDSFISSLEQLQTVVLGIAVVAVLVPLFLITNAIKVSILHRRKEIEIMRYVGATANYIRIPFLMEGTLLSLIGVVLSLILIVPVYGYIYSVLPGYFIFPVLPIPSPNEFFKFLIPAMLLIGCFIGFVGSLFSLGNHLNK